MLLQNKKIAIIGGGPGGLTLARLLQMQGVDAKVYERDTDRLVRQQGATLDLHDESGLKAIREAGLLNEFKKQYRPGADRLRICNKECEVVLDDDRENIEEDFDKEFFRPEIDRAPLRDILINSLKEESIVWNSNFLEMEKSGSGWNVKFKNGKSVYADIVIGVDGANSKIRKYITDIQPIYSGVTIVEGNIYNAAQNAPKLYALVNGGKIFSLGNKKSIILSAKGDGSLSFYTGSREGENWTSNSGIDFNNRQQIKEWFQIRFADWGHKWLELFESDECYFVPRSMYHFPLNQSWETLPNLTMIGDAAHRMPPYAGEGVNMAMLDALELCEALCKSNFDNIISAIQHFEKGMCARSSEVTESTLQNTEMFHSENGLTDLLIFFNNNKPENN